MKSSCDLAKEVPPDVFKTFRSKFVPHLIEHIGQSALPWDKVDVNVMQRVFDKVYPNIQYKIRKESALYKKVSLSITTASLVVSVTCYGYYLPYDIYRLHRRCIPGVPQ
jgi:hypothetical protein